MSALCGFVAEQENKSRAAAMLFLVCCPSLPVWTQVALCEVLFCWVISKSSFRLLGVCYDLPVMEVSQQR